MKRRKLQRLRQGGKYDSNIIFRDIISVPDRRPYCGRPWIGNDGFDYSGRKISIGIDTSAYVYWSGQLADYGNSAVYVCR